MIDLNSEHPDKESIMEAYDRVSARLRDDLSDLELLFRRVLDERTYLSKEEAAELLRCEVDDLPRQLKKYHVGINWIYKLADITEFVNSRGTKKGE